MNLEFVIFHLARVCVCKPPKHKIETARMAQYHDMILDIVKTMHYVLQCTPFTRPRALPR